MEKIIEEIASERRRQMEREGWTVEHDDEHGDGSLARAAAAYALESQQDRAGRSLWPWEPDGFKPKDRIDDLKRAGALCAAEIDRILRAEEREGHAAYTEEPKP